jgi:hypothetical protein
VFCCKQYDGNNWGREEEGGVEVGGGGGEGGGVTGVFCAENVYAKLNSGGNKYSLYIHSEVGVVGGSGGGGGEGGRGVLVHQMEGNCWVLFLCLELMAALLVTG